jgi:hypothetical protein
MWNTNREIVITSLCIGRGKRKKHEVDYTIFLDERLPKNDEALEEKMQKEAEYLESIKRSSDTSAYVSSGLSVLCRYLVSNLHIVCFLFHSFSAEVGTISVIAIMLCHIFVLFYNALYLW